MKQMLFFFLFLISSTCHGQLIKNGDVNGDTIQDIGDVVYQLTYLFLAGPPPIDIPPYFPNMTPEDAQARFINNNDGTWTDTETNLVWITGERFISTSSPYSQYSTPEEYFNAIEYAGNSDWRLPTPQEGFSLLPWGCPLLTGGPYTMRFGYNCSLEFLPLFMEWNTVFGYGNIRIMLQYDPIAPGYDCLESCYEELYVYFNLEPNQPHGGSFGLGIITRGHESDVYTWDAGIAVRELD